MSERDAFLSAVRANPADDTVRLVFADWLDDHGEPERAEFIRIQCELEPLREKLDDSRVQALWQREDELLAEHFTRWTGTVANLCEIEPQFGPVFVRGFPERVGVSLDTLLVRGDEIFAACPTVRELAVWGGAPTSITRNALIPRLTRLEVCDWHYDEEWIWMAREESIRALPSVRVWDQGQDNRRRREYPMGFISPIHWHPKGVIEVVEFLRSGDWLERLLAEINGVWRRNVVQLIQPHSARFPLLGDLGHGLFAGHLPSGTACLTAITANGKRVYLVMFNADGTFSKTLWEDGQWSGERLRQRFGFVPGLIRIREFRDRGLALRLWPTQYLNDYLRDPWRQPPGMTEPQWRTRGGVLRKWLEQGRFVVEWQGREHVADKRGRVVTVR